MRYKFTKGSLLYHIEHPTYPVRNYARHRAYLERMQRDNAHLPTYREIMGSLEAFEYPPAYE